MASRNSCSNAVSWSATRRPGGGAPVRAGLRQRAAAAARSRLGDKWHLGEVFIKINGKLYYLWRAVVQDGNVLDVLVQPRRNAVAAKRFLRKLLKGLQYVPLGCCQVVWSAAVFRVQQGITQSSVQAVECSSVTSPHLESGADCGAVVGGVHPVAGRAEVRGDATERGQNRWAEPTERNPFIACSRCRVG
ncbi:hypothetical protein M2251_000247 [Rhodococcus erythropolis]|nr:hypothetical protein [Rhodococcus erythropolis]